MTILLTMWTGLVAVATAAAPPVERESARVPAGTYRIDTAHSHVAFEVAHLGISEFSGSSGEISGTLLVDPARPAATKLDVEIPTASIRTPSDKLNTVLQTPDWLDGAKFPVIRFHALRATPSTPGNATLDGELTLRGITRPVRLAVHFTGAASNPRSAAYTIGFSATGSFKRSDFGVMLNFPVVADDLDITIAVELIKTN